MGFTVTRPSWTNDAEFEAYSRILRQQGKKLGCLPRVPDPQNAGRRWVHVWASPEEAQRLADDLREQPGGEGWHVVPTSTPPSIGPFGPLLIQLARRSDGLLVALHPLSRALLSEAFPDAAPSATNTFVD